MSTDAPRATEPSPAERIRSVIAAAASMTVIANGDREDLHGSGLVGFGDGIRLRVPADSRLAGDAACTPGGGAPALIEWTDVAPVAVRGRIRARVRIAGRLHPPQPGPEGTVTMLLEPRQVALATGRETTLVDPAGLCAAEPDPVAPFEAALLIHLDEDHRDQVAAMTRLIHPQDLLGVVRVVPLALDRYGIVLRLEYPRAQRDARLVFAEPLTDVDQVGALIHTLVAHTARQDGGPAERPGARGRAC
ncbi:DUF2470 domain-containing protein [Streptacidiphilus sp. PB12-B1b]|uniref:DUF2470 domain-containing protein n=1 Tax=Streptacidiphilus sp. PB12-B1b TaxID=2705012 RepID=UPI0015FC0FDF|nr:DUF2470 domain-containing protein [Streptacidiphilus sp. PB12-B1b]QMU77824.1 DUF2470 domain-containing protein [Streptacidiphilus sp. PB12-B1b]